MRGLDRFRASFAGYERNYVLIGGAACDVLMSEAGVPFRATRDLDIVVCVEAIDCAFGERFWSFVSEGGYQRCDRSTGAPQFYRFQDPADGGFPLMLELFSRLPDGIALPEGAHLTPLPIAEEIASLSAILLDDDYYALLQEHRKEINGVSVLDEAALIPFKARAHLDLRERRGADVRVKSEDIAKHRNDVFRLLQLMTAEARYALAVPVAADMARFIESIAADAAFDPRTFKVEMSRENGIARLRATYGL